MQSSHFPINGEKHPPKPVDFEISVFKDDLPEKHYIRIARLNFHIEKTGFVGTGLSTALAELKKQAREVGAEAIIEIKESRDILNETQIYNVSAIAIIFTAGD